MLVCQRPDIVGKMLVKRKFSDLQCGLFTNNHTPGLMDVLDYYEISDNQIVALSGPKWEIDVTPRGWYAEHPEVTFSGQSQAFGYAIFRGKTLLWSERFTFECVKEIFGWTLDLTPTIKMD